MGCLISTEIHSSSVLNSQTLDTYTIFLFFAVFSYDNVLACSNRIYGLSGSQKIEVGLPTKVTMSKGQCSFWRF